MRTRTTSYDLTLECRRAHRMGVLKRQLAWLAVLLAVAELAAGWCLLLDAGGGVLFSALALVVLVAGGIGGCYLLRGRWHD